MMAQDDDILATDDNQNDLNDDTANNNDEVKTIGMSDGAGVGVGGGGGGGGAAGAAAAAAAAAAGGQDNKDNEDNTLDGGTTPPTNDSENAKNKSTDKKASSKRPQKYVSWNKSRWHVELMECYRVRSQSKNFYSLSKYCNEVLELPQIRKRFSEHWNELGLRESLQARVPHDDPSILEKISKRFPLTGTADSILKARRDRMDPPITLDQSPDASNQSRKSLGNSRLPFSTLPGATAESILEARRARAAAERRRAELGGRTHGPRNRTNQASTTNHENSVAAVDNTTDPTTPTTAAKVKTIGTKRTVPDWTKPIDPKVIAAAAATVIQRPEILPPFPPPKDDNNDKTTTAAAAAAAATIHGKRPKYIMWNKRQWHDELIRCYTVRLQHGGRLSISKYCTDVLKKPQMKKRFTEIWKELELAELFNMRLLPNDPKVLACIHKKFPPPRRRHDL